MKPSIKNYTALHKIESLDQLKTELINSPSVYSAHLNRVLSCAFIQGMPFRTVCNLQIWAIKPKANRVRTVLKGISLILILSSCIAEKPEKPIKREFKEREKVDLDTTNLSVEKRKWLESVWKSK